MTREREEKKEVKEEKTETHFCVQEERQRQTTIP